MTESLREIPNYTIGLHIETVNCSDHVCSTSQLEMQELTTRVERAVSSIQIT